MLQNTARLILCLLAGHVLMASASYNECEPQEFRRCSRITDDVFINADKNQNLVDVYCNAYKEFGRCLASNADCVGEVIDLVRFMVHQHMILDNKLGLCTKNDLTPLRKLVQADEKYRMKIDGLKDLDAGRFDPCTAKKNLQCASQYAKEARSGESPCLVVARFYECYTESKTMVCDDKIYKDYVADVQKAGKILLKYAKAWIPC